LRSTLFFRFVGALKAAAKSARIAGEGYLSIMQTPQHDLAMVAEVRMMMMMMLLICCRSHLFLPSLSSTIDEF
jgi:hypothetical protein